MQQPLQTPAVWHAESVCLERDSIHMSSNGVLELETAVQNLMDRSLVWVEQEGYLAMVSESYMLSQPLLYSHRARGNDYADVLLNHSSSVLVFHVSNASASSPSHIKGVV